MRTLRLPTSVSRSLEEASSAASPDAPPRKLASQLAPLLPDPVHEAMIGFRQGYDGGAMLIQGVGPGEVPPSAADYRDLPVAGSLLLGLISLIATPVGIRNEWDGDPLTDVKVTPGLEKTVSSKGEGGLPLHQESQHLERPPDGLALLSIRSGSPTRLAATTDVVRTMQASAGSDLVDALRDTEYTHRLPDSYEGDHSNQATPILIGSEGTDELKVDLTTTQADSALGQEALSALNAAVAEVAMDIALNPGDLLIFDNRRWLHGRGSIAASHDRWLLRSLFVYDSWRTQCDSAIEQSPLAVFT